MRLLLLFLCLPCFGQSINPPADYIDTNVYVLTPVASELLGNIYTVRYDLVESNFSRTIKTVAVTNAVPIPVQRSSVSISGQMWLAIPVSTNSGRSWSTDYRKVTWSYSEPATNALKWYGPNVSITLKP